MSSPRLCVLAFVSSPLCLRRCITHYCITHHCITYHCINHHCVILTGLSQSLNLSACQLHHNQSYFFVSNTSPLSSTPLSLPRYQCYSSTYKRSHTHSAISSISILRARTTIPINNGYHQAPTTDSAPLTPSEHDPILYESADQLSPATTSTGFLPRICWGLRP